MCTTAFIQDSESNDLGISEPSRPRLGHGAELEYAKSVDEPEIRETANVSTICVQTRSCKNLLAELSANAEKDDIKHLKPEIRRTDKRFKMWCDAVGSAIEGPKSLDERLRYASRAKKLVLDCLEAIEAALRQALPSREQASNEEGKESSAIDNAALLRLLSSAALGSPFNHANAMIDILLRAAAAIRPTLSAERYEKAQTISLPEEELFQEDDYWELKRLFRTLGEPLREKLLSASLRRRRILQYTKDYHEKFEANRAMALPQTEETQPEILEEDKVSERGEGLEEGKRKENVTDNHSEPPWLRDADSESLVSRARSDFSISGILGGNNTVADTASETGSVASSLSSKYYYRVPPFPEEHDNNLRICIACYLLLPLPNEQIWERHILKDIRPYVCTFPDCVVDPDKLYSSRRAWFEHELNFHRRLWFCPFKCPSSQWSSLQAFDGHLRGAHSTDITALSSSDPAAVRGREIPHSAGTQCPFCGRSIPNRKRIESHIGNHQKQIALMALSSMRGVEVELESDESDENEVDGLEHEDIDLEEDLVVDDSLELLLKTCNTFLQMLEIASMNELSVETQIFYNHLRLHCSRFQMHAKHIRQTSSQVNRELVNKALHHLGSLISETCLQELRPHNITLEFRLEALNLHWSKIEMQDDGTKLEFTRRWFNLGASDKQRTELDRALESCADDLDSHEQSVNNPAEKVSPLKVAEKSFEVSKAAQSIFDAMADCNGRLCLSQHRITANLMLRTYQKPDTRINKKVLVKPPQTRSSRGGDDEDAVLEFDIFLSADHGWQELRISTAEERTSPRAVSASRKVDDLCELIERPRGVQHRLILKLTSGQLFWVGFEKSNSPIMRNVTIPEVISLSQCLGRQELFTEKMKRILSLIMGCMVLHLDGTSWLQQEWRSEDVKFFRTSSDKIPLRPFIQVQLPEYKVNIGNSPDGSLDELNMVHCSPALVSLAVALMEVFFCMPFERLAAMHDIQLIKEPSSRISFIDVYHVLNGDESRFGAWRSHIADESPLLKAIDNSLDTSLWAGENGAALDSTTFRSRIYEHVVQYLELHLAQGFSQIPLGSIDDYASSLDLGHWNLDVTTHGPSRPQALSSLPNPGHSLVNTSNQIEVNSKASQVSDIEINDKTRRYLRWRSEYGKVYRKFIRNYVPGPRVQRVKVAILDTGIDRDHPQFEAYQDNFRDELNYCDGGEKRAVDRDGCGTFNAGLILDYARDSRLYVIKIRENNRGLDAKIVARAILHAVQIWEVDVISMSFGWQSSNFEGFENLQDAIDTAHYRKVLMFTAAPTGDRLLARGYPASSPHVICVHSTDTYGNRSSFSPFANPNAINIATVGEAVQSAWPMNLCADTPNQKYVVSLSGTPYATPILAGIAAFLLQYARLHLQETERLLKRKEKMEELLRHCGASQFNSARDGYHPVALNLNPQNLFGGELEEVNHRILKVIK